MISTIYNRRISKMANESDRYPLHKAVFDNDLKNLSRLLRKLDVTTRDKHGKHLKMLFG